MVEGTFELVSSDHFVDVRTTTNRMVWHEKFDLSLTVSVGTGLPTENNTVI